MWLVSLGGSLAKPSPLFRRPGSRGPPLASFARMAEGASSRTDACDPATVATPGWMAAAKGAVEATGLDDEARAQSLEQLTKAHFGPDHPIHNKRSNTDKSEDDDGGDGDAEHAAFREAVKTGTFDMRKTVGFKWAKALEADPDLKLAYKAVGKAYSKQREFRQNWAKGVYNDKVQERSIKKENSQRSLQKGEYLPVTVIFKREGKDSAALVATQHYIADCIRKAEKGETANGKPFIAWNSMTKRNEFYYLKESHEDIYTETMTQQSKWKMNAYAHSASAGTSGSAAPSVTTPAAAPSIVSTPSEQKAAPKKKANKNKAPADEKTTDPPAKKQKNASAGKFAALDKLKKKWSSVTGAARNVLQLSVTQSGWMWASSPLVVNPLKEAQEVVDKFLNGEEFWRQWMVQDHAHYI